MSHEQITLAKKRLIFLTVFLIAVCGLIYELLAGTISSYLLGDSVYHFSLVIGFFMTSMGFGSFLSRYIDRDLPDAFVLTESVLGLVGGISGPFLFFVFSKLDYYNVYLFFIILLIGTLVGLEIPLIIRILKDDFELKSSLSNILSLDYIGALFGSLLFPLILIPYCGLIRTSLMFGLLNLLAAGLAIYVFKNKMRYLTTIASLNMFSLLILIFLIANSNHLITFFDQSLYQDDILLSVETNYQKMILTKRNSDYLLYLNGGLQFNTKDEYRYHESIVHPMMNQLIKRDHILILGGGDGMVAREVLKYKDVKKITLVDIDHHVTKYFKQHSLMKQLNGNSLNHPKVKVINQDAWIFLEKSTEIYEGIIIDLPDPHSVEISKLYTKSFYKLVTRHMSYGGAFVTQATSPLFSKSAFWCIQKTIENVSHPYEQNHSLFLLPYHSYIPSFGEWGFVMASTVKIKGNLKNIPDSLKYIDEKVYKSMIHFSDDMVDRHVKVNDLNNHLLIRYYESGWDEWFSE